MNHKLRKPLVLAGLYLFLAVLLPGSALAQDADPPLPPTPEPADELPNAPMPEMDEELPGLQDRDINPCAAMLFSTGAVWRVADIFPGGGYSSPSFLEVFNNKLYFTATNGSAQGYELWVYDGVHPPTLAWDINPSGSSNPLYLKVFNGKLYFGADGGGGAGRELWAFDGFNAPYRVQDICPAACSSDPKHLQVYNGKLYFSANAGDGNGEELWVYDGGSTISLAWNIAPGSGNSYPVGMKVFNSKLYFGANGQDGYGNELWVYDDSLFIPYRVSDINTGGNWSSPTHLEVFNNKLFFQASGGGGDYELWTYDGINPPYLAADINPGSGASYPSYLKSFNNQLYFYAADSIHSFELWAYNGSQPPYLVADILAGVNGSSPEYMQVFNNRLFFQAFGPDGAGVELWSFTPYTSTTYRSSGIYDGWVLESARTSSQGGTLNKTAATLSVGDDAKNRQYRAMLHFNTASLPDNAVITAVQLQVKRANYTGSNPFNTHGALYVDLRKGAFSNNPALQTADWQAPASKLAAGKIPKTSASNWHTINLAAANFSFINKVGVTQFRLRFNKQDNGDNGADYVSFYSGNAGTTNRPKLIITYYVP